ncbi:MAG: hypothetical protein NWR72_01205 [Bacteroidia bacterium]|nr:hypothetical protein [Bacteroidia bacterium]
MKLLNSFLSLMLLLAGATATRAEAQDPQREIIAVAPAASFSTFRLEAKGGEVRVNTTTSDSIKVHVLLTIDGIREEEAINRLERIGILDEVKGDRWEWKTDLDGMEIEYLTRLIDITYEIDLPGNIVMEIVQRNGDLTIGNRTAPVWLDVRWGNLSAGCLSGESNRIDLQFAGADIACLGNAEVDLVAGKLSIAEVNDLSLRSKGAEVEVFHANAVDIQAHAGEYHFRKAASISGTMTSSRLDVDTLTEEGDLDLSLMAGAEVGLSDLAQRLKITADLAPVTVSYPKARTVSLDLEARKDDLASIEVDGLPEAESLPDNKVRYHSDWAVARSANPALQIDIRSKRGRVKIIKE